MFEFSAEINLMPSVYINNAFLSARRQYLSYIYHGTRWSCDSSHEDAFDIDIAADWRHGMLFL